MKKIISVILAAVMLFALAGCGAEGLPEVDKTALEVLTEIWDGMPEDQHFMSFGGDYDAAVENAPGSHAIGDGSDLENGIGYPAANISMIDEAASMRHMLNANTFTCGAYHLTEDADIDEVCKGIRDSLMNRAYMCGWPETLYVIKIGSRLVVNVFGANDLVTAFKDKAVEIYGDAAVVAIEEDMSTAGGDNTASFAVPELG